MCVPNLVKINSEMAKKSKMGATSTPDTVGPCSYKISGGIGKQLVSTRPTSPTWGMGSSSRDQAQTVCSPGYAPTPTTKNPGGCWLGVFGTATFVYACVAQ